MTQREKLVAVALGELGKSDGSVYVRWYNQASGRNIPLNSAYCAIFVSWCARQSGLSDDQLPLFSGCTSGRNTFKRMGIWYDRDKRVPRRGDLALFDWDGDPSMSEHVGIVTGADDKYVYTVEGNAGTPGKVREKKYGRHSAYILGYVAWKEKEEEADMTKEEVQDLVKSEVNKAFSNMKAELAQSVVTAVSKAHQDTSAGITRAAEELRRELTPTVYHTVEEVPEWARPTVERLVAAGSLRGDENGNLRLDTNLLRMLVVQERILEVSNDEK